mgnify:FL=1
MLQHYQLLLRRNSADVMSSSAAADVQHTETEAAEALWDISFLQRRQPGEADKELRLRSEYHHIREYKPHNHHNQHHNTLYNHYLSLVIVIAL